MRFLLSVLFIGALIFFGAKFFKGGEEPSSASHTSPAVSAPVDQPVDATPAVPSSTHSSVRDGIKFPAWALWFLAIGASVGFVIFSLLVMALVWLAIDLTDDAHPVAAGAVFLVALVLLGLANTEHFSNLSFGVSLILSIAGVLLGWLIVGLVNFIGMWKYDHHRYRLRVDDHVHEFNRAAGRRGASGLVLENVPADQAWSFQESFKERLRYSRMRETPPHPDKDRSRNISRIAFGPLLIVPNVLSEGLILFTEFGLKPLIGSMRKESEKSAKQRSALVQREPATGKEVSS